MKVQQIADLENYTHINSYNDAKGELSSVFTSDLLSDVVANAEENSLLITIQAHKNTIAVASLVGIKAIIFCSGRKADEETINSADNENIMLFSTPDNQFTASCKIGELF